MKRTPHVPALRLRAGGRVAATTPAGPARVRFIVPAPGAAVLLSPTLRPSDVLPWLDDRRRLGVCVGACVIGLGDGSALKIAPDDPAFGDGWFDVERPAGWPVRWCGAESVLNLPPGAATLTLDIVADGGINLPTLDDLDPV